MAEEHNEEQTHDPTPLEMLADWAAGGTPGNWAPNEDYKEALARLNNLMNLYKCAIMETETRLKVLNTRFSLEKDRNPISNITSRLKTPESIYEKVHRANIKPGIDELIDNMHDIAGLRVVCSFVEDVYQLVDCLERQDDITILRQRDYIANPKPNGYRSLHLIAEVPVFLPEGAVGMKVEIQLRTIAMESWASLEHKLRYKKNMDPELLQAIAKELSQCAQLSARLDTRMQTIRYLIDGFSALDEAALIKQLETNSDDEDEDDDL